MTHSVSGDPPASLDLIAVGTALIDHLSFADLATIEGLGLSLGAMTLVDDVTAAVARARLREERIVSGGTVANTAAGFASFGGRAGFVGAVANDEFANRYTEDLRACGVHPFLVDVGEGNDAASTGACYVMVTPGEERTMATHLGVSGELRAEHLPVDSLNACQVCYFDGYLFDFPGADGIVSRLVDVARSSHVTLALGLADRLVVERHRDRIGALVPEVGILFSNEDEIKALAGTDDLESAAQRFRHDEMAVVVTRSELGAIIVDASGTTRVDAVPVPHVVDVTGAGDLFAAGVLYAVVAGLGLERGGQLGALAASEVISHLGARPEQPLQALAAKAGLIAAP